MTDWLLADAGTRRLYGLYADALWRRDTQAFAGCFAKDAVWKIAGQRLEGHAAIAAMFEKAMTKAHKVAMFTGLPVICVEGGEITARTQITEYSKLDDGTAIRTLGIYYDRLVAVEGRWLFQWHHFNLYYYGPPDFSAPYHDCPEYGPPPGFPGVDDPTTVRG